MTDVNMELKFYRNQSSHTANGKRRTANGKRQTVKPGILPEPFPVSRLNGGEWWILFSENWKCDGLRYGDTKYAID